MKTNSMSFGLCGLGRCFVASSWLFAVICCICMLSNPARAEIERLQFTGNISNTTANNICRGKPGLVELNPPITCGSNKDLYFFTIRNGDRQKKSRWTLQVTNASGVAWPGGFNVELVVFNTPAPKNAAIVKPFCNGTPTGVQPQPYELNCPLPIKNGGGLLVQFDVEVPKGQGTDTVYYILRVCDAACGFLPTPTSSLQLEESASPSTGVAGVNYVSVIGSTFPQGNIGAENVRIELAEVCHDEVAATTSAVSIASISAESKALSFLLPRDLSPGEYFVSIGDSKEGDVNFESSNCAKVIIQ